jgi:hypothetical protein
MDAPSPRRRLQVRLTTLMIAVTLVAVILGSLSWWSLGAARIADERQTLLKRIVESGGGSLLH